jgi:hypothetical protein
MSHAVADQVAPHVDMLLQFLGHDEWWLQNAALQALTPVAADVRCYAKVLPAIGELIRTNQRAALTLGLLPGIRQKLQEADAEIQKLAVETLREAYTGYAGVDTAPTGQDISSTVDAHLEYIAASLAEIPGGLDVVYEIARERYPDEILPYKDFFLSADPAQFGPKLRQAIKPIIEGELIPEYVGRNRVRLQALARSEVQRAQCGADEVDELAGLYQRAGHDDFGWKIFADIREADWFYHSFDPIPSEQKPKDYLITRYREVTLPQGMADWFAVDFDPDAAGWQVGQAPFGQYDGRIPDGAVSKCTSACTGPVCYGARPIHTMWEKEVLLMRRTFKIPALKDGHRYRIRVNHRAHVGNGGGYGIWVNGKPMITQEKCIGRGGGEKPYGAYITREWFDDFDGGEVTIAVQSFLRYNDKYKVKPSEPLPQGMISVHLEEQRLPPMGMDLVAASATVVPMKSLEWQLAQFAESEELRESAPAFRWDGRVQPVSDLLGSWKLVGEVRGDEVFEPAKPRRPHRPAFSTLHLQADGSTGDPLRLWTGQRVLDLERYEALGMELRTVGGQEFLFVEAGGYSERHKPGWQTTWRVFARAR